jgi:hypothetical protein
MKKILIFTICALLIGTVPVYAANTDNTTNINQLQYNGHNILQNVNNWYTDFEKNSLEVNTLVKSQSIQNQIATLLQNQNIRTQIHSLIQNKDVKNQVNKLMKNKDVQNDINILMKNPKIKSEVNMIYNNK